MIDEVSLDRPATPVGGETAESLAWREIRAADERDAPPVACVFCGCDLYPDPTAAGDEAWFHFAPVRGRDANGCRLRCATSTHTADGWPRRSGDQG